MGRRRGRDDFWIGPVAQLAGLVLAAAWLLPGTRELISHLGLAMVSMAVVLGLGFIAFGFVRLFGRASAVDGTDTVSYSIVPPLMETGPPSSSRNLVRLSTAANPKTTSELLDQLRSIDWFQFEKVVDLTYRKLGYEVTRRGGANPDGGIDLIAEKGGDRIAIQCKHWRTWNVGVKPVREFLGAMTDSGLQKGVVLTLAGYTAEARQLAERHGIEIINEVGLAKMIESTAVRYQPEALAILQDSHKCCPKCEAELVLRTARKGAGAGQQFWGCSAYPRCRFTMPLK